MYKQVTTSNTIRNYCVSQPNVPNYYIEHKTFASINYLLIFTPVYILLVLLYI